MTISETCIGVVDTLIGQLRKEPAWGGASSWDRYISAVMQLAEVAEEEGAYSELMENDVDDDAIDIEDYYDDARNRARNMVLQMMLAQDGTSEPDPTMMGGLLEVAEMSLGFRELVRDVLEWRKTPKGLAEILTYDQVVSLDVLSKKVS